MARFLLLAFSILVLISCQKKVVQIPVYKYEQKVNYSEIIGCLDRPAEFPEPDRWAMYQYGLKGFNQDLNLAIKYPKAALEQKLEGMVLVRFIVEIDGYVYRTEVINSTNSIFDQAAQEAIKNTNQWIPALIDKRAVASMYKLPVYFAISK